MKRHIPRSNSLPGRLSSHRPCGAQRHGGAVIILALAMLISLMFLGLFFFGFTNDESNSATAFAAREDAHLDREEIINTALEQLIVGTRGNYPNSALYSSNGSYHSLVADVLGVIDHDLKPTDIQPFSGSGLRLVPIPGAPGTLPDFDIDYTSTTKTSANFVLNFSPGRNGGVDPTDTFQPDDGTSYWDINSPFLAYDGYIVDASRNMHRVVMPSFFVAGLFARQTSTNDLYTNSAYATQVFRPHSAHVDGTTSRYLTATTDASSGDTSRKLGPFPLLSGATTGPETGLYNDAGSANPVYKFDVDIDGDGQSDSIYLDLDHPIVNLPGNRQAVPIYSVKILPLDGKMNVNGHGNKRGDTYGNEPNGTISRSNDGISRDEINLAYALAADPQSTNHIDAAVKSTLLGMYGLPSTATAAEVSEQEMRAIVEGRYGADGAPGISGDDAPTDAGAGSAFGQPIDYVGIGNWVGRDSTLPAAYQSGVDRGLRRSLIASTGGGDTSPTPSYDSMQNSVYSGSYHTNPGNYNSDEGDETILEPPYANSDDEIFPPAELFSLYASESLLSTTTSASSRLLNLAPFNLRDSLLASRSRKKLTTDSWDRLEFTMQKVAERPWEFETTPWSLTTGGYTVEASFPPKFDGAAIGATTDPKDPFRPALRMLLAQKLLEDGTNNTRLIRQRLNVNRLLTGIDSARIGEPTYLFPSTDFPFADSKTATGRAQRQAMARDLYVLLYTLCGPEQLTTGAMGTAADITSVNTATAVAPVGVTPTVPPGETRTTQGRLVLDDTTLLEMAQFAVNVVDSLDVDDTITVFEYDRDLGNGWNLDDDPMTTTDPAGAGERDVVFGVERQELALSEALCIYVKKTPGNDNHDGTEFDESADRSFAYIELQNFTDHAINFAELNYQILFQVYTKDANGVETEAWKRYLTPNTGTVAAGARFTIGTAGDTHNQNMGTPRESYFRVDPNYDPALMVPATFQTLIPASGSLNLDLITGNGFTLHDAGLASVTATKGDFFPPAQAKLVDDDKSKAADAGRRFVRMSLRRRMNEGSTTLTPDVTTDNLWVTIDSMEIDPGASGGYGLFDLANDMVPAATVQMKLRALLSNERPQPLDRSNEGAFSPAGNISNSIGSGNSNTATDLPNGFNLYQPHFNRDLTSVMELLSIPLYGPHETTLKLATGTEAQLVGDNTAASKFLHPQHPSNVAIVNGAMGTIEPKLDNRWYRLFEFVGVDHGLDASYRDSLLYRRRIWGEVCLNTIDDESALAGLIEDDMVNGFRDLSDPLTNRLSQTSRNWYRQFVISRDGEDPRAAGQGLPLPGLAGVSRPFVPFSKIDSIGADPSLKHEGLDHTLLRSHRAPESTPTTVDLSPVGSTHFGLFEARDSSDVDSSGNTANRNVIDYHTRQRILGKISNNTTTRNNLFVVWVRFDFFEAHTVNDGTNDIVQIGSKIDDVPGATEFLVVDRTRLEEAYDANGSLNYLPFIIYRQRVQ